MKNSNITRNRLNYIDELKGFAILCGDWARNAFQSEKLRHVSMLSYHNILSHAFVRISFRLDV